jgi:cytochrome bd-type quinol oxidase subunit 2
MIFIATSAVATWISFKSNGFSTDDQASSAQGGALFFLIASILLPIFYGVFAYIKASDAENPNPNTAKLSKDSILIIIMLTFVLLIVVSSFGIWMTNANQNWSSHQEENGIEIYFIIVLVLALVLPFLYGIFYFRKEICKNFVMKPSSS